MLTVIETLGAGGAERVLVSLLPALQERGHECAVAVLRPPLTLEGDLADAGIAVHDLRLAHRWDLVRGVPRLWALTRAGRFDVLHGHLFFAGLYVALVRPLVHDTATVATFHNLGYDSFPADTTWRCIRKRIDVALMHTIDRRVAVSEAVAVHYRRHLGVEQVEVVPNGLDLAGIAMTSADRAKVLKRMGLDPKRPVLVAVGRFVPEKAYGDLVAAVAAVRDGGCAVQLVVVGDGPGRPEVEAAIAAAGLQAYVVLAGSLPHAEVLETVAAADVFVSSSTHEGFPLSPAEAMALGRPLAVTAVGGVPELVGDDGAGILVAPSHPHDLAAAIVELLRDPVAAAAAGETGRRRVAELFSVETMAGRLEDIYTQALAHRRER